MVFVQKWGEEHVAEQNALPLSETPKLTVKQIGEKVANLDREVKYLLNKARFAQPLKKKENKEKETKSNETSQNKTESG